jgi:hypothetical protein
MAVERLKVKVYPTYFNICIAIFWDILCILQTEHWPNVLSMAVHASEHFICSVCFVWSRLAHKYIIHY